MVQLGLDKQETISRKVKCPCVYKHFKGDYYATMGVSVPRSPGDIARRCEGAVPGSVTTLETLVRIFKSDYVGEQWMVERIKHYYADGEWCHVSDLCPDRLVLYKALYDASGVYSREENMFLSKIDRDKYPEEMQDFRFIEYIGT